MIIVAGPIFVTPGRRDAFVAGSLEAVVAARETPGCLDFVVAADPVDADRVNVFERWASQAHLEAFRGAGPTADLTADIAAAEVAEWEVSDS
jgi:quinol monooxygenase YgiN